MQERFGKPPEVARRRRPDDDDGLAMAWASAAAAVPPAKTLLPKTLLLPMSSPGDDAEQPPAYLPLMGSLGADTMDAPSSGQQLSFEEARMLLLTRLTRMWVPRCCSRVSAGVLLKSLVHHWSCRIHNLLQQRRWARARRGQHLRAVRRAAAALARAVWAPPARRRQRQRQAQARPPRPCQAARPPPSAPGMARPRGTI